MNDRHGSAELTITLHNMNDRQRQLLGLVIKEHIKTALPVGSGLLVGKSKLDVSSATVRNELSELEKEGFIYQPHTSAGRVPTEKGYRYYIENFMDKRELKTTETMPFNEVLKNSLVQDMALKSLAKQMVEFSKETVIVAFDKNNVYYTGIANLFGKPEFADPNMVSNLSEVIDHLDEVVNKVFDQINDVQILIGSENPFGTDCAAILGKYQMKDKRDGLFIILGPMRMEYDRNLALVEYVRKSLIKST